MAGASHAHFGFDPRFLEWEARHGRPALAALAERGDRRGAIVLREEGGQLRSGWPWRFQMIMAGSRPEPAGLGSDEAGWLLDEARRLAGPRRLQCFGPFDSAHPGPGYRAGVTMMNDLRHPDDALLQSLGQDTRRVLKRAVREGFQVIEATDVGQMRRFGDLQAETERRRGARPMEHRDPGPGEGWREWEHPWMWLLLAVRDGKIEAGSGFGVREGQMVDYRTNASTLEGFKGGANHLLGVEALRRARERGYRWLNWCGSTQFKRHMGGERVEIGCRLGGGPLWAVPNQLASTLQQARWMLASWRRGRGVRTPAPVSSG